MHKYSSNALLSMEPKIQNEHQKILEKKNCRSNVNYTEKKLSSASLLNAKLKNGFLLFFKVQPLMLCRCKGSSFLREQVETFLGFGELMIFDLPISQ